MITIREIAELAGTSRGTVDRALKGRGGVREETRLLIEQICREHHYTPNRAGVMLGMSKRQFRIGVILPSLESGRFDGVIRGLELAETEFSDFGVRLELYELGFDSEEQIAAIDRLEESGMQALILAPVASGRLTERVVKLQESGIEVVTVGSDLSAGRRANVRCGFERCGRTAGELCGLLAGGETPVGIGVVAGGPGLAGSEDKLLGLLESVKQFPNVSVRRIVECGSDQRETEQKISKMIKNYPDIRVIYSASAALAAVLSAASGKLEIVSLEADDFAEDLLKTGKIRFAVSEQGEAQGRLAVKLLVDRESGLDVPEYSEFPSVILSRYSF